MLSGRFAHLHFFASNAMHSGVNEGFDSVQRIFNAMLGDIAEEDKCGPRVDGYQICILVEYYGYIEYYKYVR